MEIVNATKKDTAVQQFKEAAYGVPVIHDQSLLMKVKPTGFLLNSSIVADVLNRGDSFAVNLETGTLYAVKGDKLVKACKSKLVYEI